MVTILLDKSRLIANDEITVSKKLLLSPLLDSDCKIFILYLLCNDGIPDFRFSWVSFQAATGIRRKRVDKIKMILLNKYELITITDITKGWIKIITEIKLDYTQVLNLLEKPLTVIKKRLKFISLPDAEEDSAETEDYMNDDEDGSKEVEEPKQDNALLEHGNNVPLEHGELTDEGKNSMAKIKSSNAPHVQGNNVPLGHGELTDEEEPQQHNQEQQ